MDFFDRGVAAWENLLPSLQVPNLSHSPFDDRIAMQPRIPQKSNLLQSRRFLTHQPTFESAFSGQDSTGLESKQEDVKTPVVQLPSPVSAFRVYDRPTYSVSAGSL